MLKLKKGINLGGWFSQCLRDEEHYKTFITKDDFIWISEHKFDHVRIPVDYDFLVDESFCTIEEHFCMLDKAFEFCRETGLCAVLDLHRAPGYDFNKAGRGKQKQALFYDPKIQNQFLELWSMLAIRYASLEFVAFELLNEVVDGEYIEPWNRLIKRTVETIRTKAPNNTIIYGGALWNSAKTLQFLEKPEDPNVLFTFHYYEPIIFTHQKANWVNNMNDMRVVFYPGDSAYYKKISYEIGMQGLAIQNFKGKIINKEFSREFIQSALLIAKKYNISLYCGEFGVIDQAPEESTENWMKDTIDIFEEYGIGYAIWNYREMDFGVTGEHYKKILRLLCR